MKVTQHDVHSVYFMICNEEFFPYFSNCVMDDVLVYIGLLGDWY